MLFELRRYLCAPGRRNDLDDLMRDTVIPFMTAKGMVIVATFFERDDIDRYTWIRRFKDDDHRTELREAVYGSKQWKDEIFPLFDGLLIVEDIEVTELIPTATSVLQ